MKNTLFKKSALIVLLVAFIAFMSMCFISINNVKADESSTVIAKTVDEVAFTMEEGASVRTSNDNKTNGLRFAASMSATDYAGLKANEDYTNLIYGVVIAPADYIDGENRGFTEENLFGNSAIYAWDEYVDGEWVYDEEANAGKTRIINITATKLDTTKIANKAIITASITNLYDNNIPRDFVARGYIIATLANGDLDYEMADYYNSTVESNIRSMAIVAEKAIADNGEYALGDEQKDWLKQTYLENSKVVNDKTADVVELNNYSVDGKELSLQDMGTVKHVTDGNGNELEFTHDGTNLTLTDVADYIEDNQFNINVYTESNEQYRLNKFAINFDYKDKIETEADFLAIRSAISGDFVLMNDITLTSNLTAPTATFGGSLDGNGKTISGVNITGAFGLFSTVGPNSVIKNLFIENATIGAVQTGVIATFLSAGATLDNIYVSASIKSGNHSGGLVKQIYGSETLQTKVTNCVVNITDTTWVASNGLIFGFGANNANVDLTGTYGISTVASATLVGNRTDYATFRDKINALNTTENKMIYNSVKDFNTAIYNGKVSLGNRVLGLKVAGIVPISTADELLAMRLTSGSGKIYALINDIDLKGQSIATDPATHWLGTFDGHGFAIKNFKLTYNSTAVGGTGFFRSITGTVKNVAFVGATFGYAQGGVVCCQLKAGGTIDNVYVKVDLTGTSAAGGIVKTCETSSKVNITNCVVYATNSAVPTNGVLIISYAGSAAASDDIFNCTGTYGVKANANMKLAGRESSYPTFYAWLNGKDTASTPRSFVLSDFNSAVSNKTVSVDSVLLSKII